MFITLMLHCNYSVICFLKCTVWYFTARGFDFDIVYISTFYLYVYFGPNTYIRNLLRVCTSIWNCNKKIPWQEFQPQSRQEKWASVKESIFQKYKTLRTVLKSLNTFKWGSKSVSLRSPEVSICGLDMRNTARDGKTLLWCFMAWSGVNRTFH